MGANFEHPTPDFERPTGDGGGLQAPGDGFQVPGPKPITRDLDSQRSLETIHATAISTNEQAMMAGPVGRSILSEAYRPPTVAVNATRLCPLARAVGRSLALGC